MTNENNSLHESADSKSITSEELYRELHMQKILDQIQELTAGKVILGKFDSCPPEVYEAFLEEVLELEREEARKRRA